jgi:hypothetical protein
VTGSCRPTPCSANNCPAGTLCLNSTGLCANDPCEQVRCGQGQVCVVGDDGTPDCSIPAVSGVAIQTQAKGGGAFGCSCSIARAAPSGWRGLGDVFAALVAVGLWLGRRRRRAKDPLEDKCVELGHDGQCHGEASIPPVSGKPSLKFWHEFAEIHSLNQRV